MNEPAMEWVTVAEFAGRHGVSKQAVMKAIHGGRFSRGTTGRNARGMWLIHSERGNREWDCNANPAMRPSWPLRAGNRAPRGR